VKIDSYLQEHVVFFREAGIISLYSESERGVRKVQDNPTLSREQIDRLRSAAQLRSVRSGEVLHEPACPDVPLFVVLDGTVSITRAGEDEKILAVREPGQFTGEMSVISGGRSLLTARVTRDGVVLEVTR
jgi:thioredoxin reductase (NADPH)